MPTHLAKIAAAAAAGLALASCATAPSHIAADHVSSDKYAAYDCDQVRQELFRVSDRTRKLGDGQALQSVVDPVLFGVGVTVFWPALILLAGGDHEDQISDLKGQYEALESSAIDKKCPVAQELAEARAPRAMRARP